MFNFRYWSHHKLLLITLFTISIIIVILIIFIIRREEFGHAFSDILSHLPEEFHSGLHVYSHHVNFTNVNYMRNNWKKVCDLIRKGHIPPVGRENCWTEDEKKLFLTKLVLWGEKQL